MKKTVERRILYRTEDLGFEVVAVANLAIREPAIPLWFHGFIVGSFDAIEFYSRSSNGSYPLVGVDLIANAFIRLSYHRSDGKSGTLGTSVLGAPSFRLASGILNYVPAILSAHLEINNEYVEITLQGHYDNLATVQSRRRYRIKPGENPICELEMSLTTQQELALATSHVKKDAFRMLTLSSMFSGERYDANSLHFDSASDPLIVVHLANDVVRGSHHFTRSLPLSTFVCLNTDGDSSGRRGQPGAHDAPTVTIQSLNSDFELGAQLYLDSSEAVDDDSLTAWVEWRNVPPVIKLGTTITARFLARTTAPLKR